MGEGFSMFEIVYKRPLWLPEVRALVGLPVDVERVNGALSDVGIEYTNCNIEPFCMETPRGSLGMCPQMTGNNLLYEARQGPCLFLELRVLYEGEIICKAEGPFGPFIPPFERLKSDGVAIYSRYVSEEYLQRLTSCFLELGWSEVNFGGK